MEAPHATHAVVADRHLLDDSRAGPDEEAAEGRPPSHCIAFVENTPRFEVIRAAATDGAQAFDYRSVVPPETVRISYIDHSRFLIQTPGGLSMATDYNGFIGPTDFTPDVVTMIRQPH
jgi:hypothetical protein